MDMEMLLRDMAIHQGVDFFGIADVTLAEHFIVEQGGEWLRAFPRAISIGITLPHAVVDQLPRRSERAVGTLYRSHAYHFVNQRLDQTTSMLAAIVQRKGFHAVPVPASIRIDDERICALFSHKLAAHLAGLGWIGKSCLLVTPEAGPRVRWATVLTDAALAATGTPMETRCGSCSECVEVCPVQAFHNRLFLETEARSARYDAARCDAYLKGLQAKDAEAGVCGMCLYVCPHGLKASRALKSI